MKKRPDVCTTAEPVDRYADVTGRLVLLIPPGPECDEMLGLVRMAVKFKRQQCGRRNGRLHNYIVEVVSTIKGPVTFEALLDELELAAARRELQRASASASPIEKVDRVWEVVTFHDPRAGIKEVTFKRLQNILTKAKKKRFPTSAKP